MLPQSQDFIVMVVSFDVVAVPVTVPRVRRAG
jgi:hypothetical protein